MLLHDNQIIEFTSPRLLIKVHGSGCTLSSYIAGYLAQGYDLIHAVAGSKRRIQDAIAMSSQLGKGMAMVNPMATKQKEAMRYPWLESVRSAIKTIESRLPPSFVPGKGIELVYALPNPQDFLEICGGEGLPDRPGDAPDCGRGVVFGNSSWMARAIMMVNISFPDLWRGSS